MAGGRVGLFDPTDSLGLGASRADQDIFYNFHFKPTTTAAGLKLGGLGYNGRNVWFPTQPPGMIYCLYIVLSEFIPQEKTY